MFYGTYIGNNKMLIKTRWGIRLIAPCEDMSLMPTLLVDGIIEQGLTNWTIRSQDTIRGKTIVDVGANIGYFTTLFAAIGSNVYSYEANPDIYSFLEENIYLSQFQNKVVLSNTAVSDSKEHIPFYRSRKYQGNSSIVKHTSTYREQFATDHIDSVFVESSTLDLDLIDKGDIYLVKIDVEGAELRVFLGMENLLKSGKVKNVVFELNKSMLGEDTDKLFDFLSYYESNNCAFFYTFNPDGTTSHVKIRDIFSNNYIDNILMKFG